MELQENIPEDDLTIYSVINRLAPAPSFKRFQNSIIDRFFLIFVVGFILIFADIVNPISPGMKGRPLLPGLLAILVVLGYYPVLEYFTGKTIGKSITKTTTVNKDGTKPSFSQIIIRSSCRLIPFNQFSFLSARPVGWHDTFSDTMVVEDAVLQKYREGSLGDIH